MAMNNYYQNMNNGYPYMNRNLYEQNNQQNLKGHPVTSFEEVRASMIDFDGSIFYFPDLANKKIYTKQINADGSPSFKVYQLVEQQPIELQNFVQPGGVSKEDFDKTIGALSEEISQIKQKVFATEKEEFRF